MFTVELYANIRHAAMIDGLSRREAAKRVWVHRIAQPTRRRILARRKGTLMARRFGSIRGGVMPDPVSPG